MRKISINRVGREKSFRKDESGASAVEYALVLALITGLMVAVIGDETRGFGLQIKGFFDKAADKMSASLDEDSSGAADADADADAQ